ncbi:hypothetical protein [Bacillus sp. FJAT-27245]|uniref:hypothetical protein n=1 Tax=Bacillus sp. FJAT-27245 TaxID=1684144 RepID=UPI001E2F057F|nr:hypothetical protein [Bacillus sp. FJAT-27245]
MNKKAVQLAMLASAAAVSIAAVNPHQAEAASTAESLVVKAEANKVILIRATSVDYNANPAVQPWTEYNKAKKDYAAAKAAVAKAPAKEREKLNARLDIVKMWIDRTAAYIDAISSGRKLAALQSQLNSSLDKADFVKATATYHTLSYEIKKQAKILYKVYGQSTRQAILEAYKLPAEKAKADALYPISIYIEIGRLGTALEAGDETSARKFHDNIVAWFEELEDEDTAYALLEYYIETVSPYLDVQEEISHILVDDNYELATGDPNAYGFYAFSFYNEEGEEIFPDPFEQGYMIKDDKGFFREDGTLAEAYAKTGIPKTETGTVKIQLLKSETGEVVAENTVPLVESLLYWSLDAGKLVDESGNPAATLAIGQTYQFVPTKATDQNDEVIGDDPGETLKLEDFKGITYKSQNPEIFTVDESGKVTAVESGKASLVVTYNGWYMTILVNVETSAK